MTKKQIHKWAKAWGYTSSYSGKTKTMYIDGITWELLATAKEMYFEGIKFNLHANY